MESVERMEGLPTAVEVSPARRGVMMNTANILMDARRTKITIPELAESDRPTTLEEAYLVQDELSRAYGAIGGWKVGAPGADASPLFAPMPLVWVAASGAEIRGLCYRGLEAEVAFLLGEDLPPRHQPYSRDEVLGAVQSCHPVIEVLDSAFDDPGKVDRFSMIADLQMHGAFIYGPAYAAWKDLDFTRESVTLAVDGIVRVERTGSNTSGNLLRLLPWLANEASPRTDGLRAGQWITTGSWTGNTRAEKHSTVDVTFSTLGRVMARFAPEQDLEKGLPGTTRTFN